MDLQRIPIVILGAGPAGLGAALQLARRSRFDVTVLEKQDRVGGNAGSFELSGIPVDFGSHRLHPTCSQPILDDIRLLLKEDLLDRPRYGRIRLQGRWLHFPLKPFDLAVHLPPRFACGVFRDAVLRRHRTNGQSSFASVLEAGLGKTICREFYFPYAQKIWGLPPQELDAEQARRRVSAISVTKLGKKVATALPGLKKRGAGRFFYPRHGFGQISEAYSAATRAAGARIELNSAVTAVQTQDNRVIAVHALQNGVSRRYPASQILSTIPLPALLCSLKPAPAEPLLAAARSLSYRAMILVYLVLEAEQFTPFDAHYFPETANPLTRLSEPKNYGLANVPGKTVLCAELPCSTNDAVWQATDVELQQLVCQSLATTGLPIKTPIRDVVIRRLAQAYPIYKSGFQQSFDQLDAWVDSIDGLLTLGRQGLFAHDNTHHTLAMAYSACECLDDAGRFDRDRWHHCRQGFSKHVVED